MILPSGDTGATARMIIMEPTVTVSIIFLMYTKTILAQSTNYKSSDYFKRAN